MDTNYAALLTPFVLFNWNYNGAFPVRAQAFSESGTLQLFKMDIGKNTHLNVSLQSSVLCLLMQTERVCVFWPHWRAGERLRLQDFAHFRISRPSRPAGFEAPRLHGASLCILLQSESEKILPSGFHDLPVCLFGFFFVEPHFERVL